MRHFIVKMIPTSTEKEEEYEGELIGTDVERGFIDLPEEDEGRDIENLFRKMSKGLKLF
jgi:hypothetical protein